MVPIWQISVIYHHAIDQWFSARRLEPPPRGLKIIFCGCGISGIKKTIFELCKCVTPLITMFCIVFFFF